MIDFQINSYTCSRTSDEYAYLIHAAHFSGILFLHHGPVLLIYMLFRGFQLKVLCFDSCRMLLGNQLSPD